ncbi:MAG: hypothetical protein ABIW19_07450 [Vicinamibacterales bacterium]
MALSCVVLLCVPRDASAYLDPGAGSMAFQTAVAALAGVAYGIRLYWSKILTLLGARPSKSDDIR